MGKHLGLVTLAVGLIFSVMVVTSGCLPVDRLEHSPDVTSSDDSHALFAPPPRPFVQRWRTSDFASIVDQLGSSARDIPRGKLVFVVECLYCHQVNGVGGTFGPDLSLLGKHRNPSEIVKATLEPSAEIEPRYRQVQLEMDDGRIVSGWPTRETEDAVWLVDDIRLLDEPPRKFSKGEIVGQRLSRVSAMPSGSLDTYSRDEVLDLFSFLVSLGAAE